MRSLGILSKSLGLLEIKSKKSLLSYTIFKINLSLNFLRDHLKQANLNYRMIVHNVVLSQQMKLMFSSIELLILSLN